MITCQSQTDFATLVQHAAEGDRTGLDRLAAIVEPKLKAHFLRMTLDIDLTADFTQETMLRMLRGLPRLQNPESFWPWLFRIAGNLLNDHYRQNGRTAATRFSAIDPQNLDDCLRDDSCLPESSVFRHEARAMVRSAISTLKEKPRQILAMRCYENMTYEQIGTHIGCTDLAARTTFSRAKKAIRNYLKSQGVISL